MAFTKLFEPVNIGKVTLRNRIAMAPMGTSLATKDGLVTDVMREYYEARARGGSGMVIVESTNIDIRSLNEPNRPLIDSDLTLPGLRRLAAAIKKHGAFAAIQLNHCGGCTKSKVSGYPSLAPSAMIFPAGATKGEMAKELTTEQINEIVELFAKAAARAKKAGFDGIEIHAAHPYLLAQFLSPFINHRRDSYGGSLENRARALIEVLTAVRKAVSKNYPVWFRINGQEYGVPDGLTLDDARKVARMVKGLVDAIHVTSFGYGKAAQANFPETPGGLLLLAAAIKKVVDVPVIAVGRLDPETGEQAVKAGQADIIAMGRRMIADPEIAGKAKAGRLQDITPCIACFCCHDLGVLKDKPITCTVNPGLAKGNEYEIKPARKIKQVAVIGGGPAGMEAALVLATRGHKVTLFEKSASLGGQLKLAMAAPGKRERIEPLITYLSAQLEKLDIEIKLNTGADVNTISALNPDAVILASGANPIAPKLNGVASSYVVTAFDVLAGREVGKNVVIIGAGSVGCETADYLNERGKKVTVVELLPEIAMDMGGRDRTRLMARLSTLPITFVTAAKCSEIRDGVCFAKDGQDQSIKADTVVLAVGARPENALFPELKAKGFEVHLAGDCWHVGRIIDAMGDGLRLGCAI